MNRILLLLGVLIVAFSFEMRAQSHYVWKESNRDLPEQSVNNPRTTDGIEIYTKPGVIIVRTPVKAAVKVLSILGQTISQTIIPQGIYELQINTHGIFIVKVGDNTIRVAL